MTIGEIIELIGEAKRIESALSSQASCKTFPHREWERRLKEIEDTEID